MKKLCIFMLVLGLCACSGTGNSSKKSVTQEQCDMLEGIERDGCLTELSRKQDRERERQKKKALCGTRLEC